MNCCFIVNFCLIAHAQIHSKDLPRSKHASSASRRGRKRLSITGSSLALIRQSARIRQRKRIHDLLYSSNFLPASGATADGRRGNARGAKGAQSIGWVIFYCCNLRKFSIGVNAAPPPSLMQGSRSVKSSGAVNVLFSCFWLYH